MQAAANWPASRAALFVVSAQQLAGFWIDEMHTPARQALDGPVHVIVRAIIGQPCLHVLARGGTSIEEGTHLIGLVRPIRMRISRQELRQIKNRPPRVEIGRCQNERGHQPSRLAGC